MGNCLKTQLKGSVDAILPKLGLVQFHVPYAVDYTDTERTIVAGSTGSNTLLKTTGSFSIGGSTTNNVVLNPNVKMTLMCSNEASGSLVTIENYYDIIDLAINEAIVAGIQNDSNLDSLMSFSNIKRFIYRDLRDTGGNKNFLTKAKTLLAFYYNCGNTNTEQSEIVTKVIRNNPNLRYVEINTAARVSIIEEVQNLDLIQEFRGWVGNIEHLGVGVRRKDINSSMDNGNLQVLINRLIASGRTSGAIKMDYLNLADHVYVGSVTGKAFCQAEGTTGNTIFITWDSNGTIHATSTQPGNYEAPNININSSVINELVYPQ